MLEPMEPSQEARQLILVIQVAVLQVLLAIAAAVEAAEAHLGNKTELPSQHDQGQMLALAAAAAAAVVPLSVCLPILAPQHLLEALAVMLVFILLAVVVAAAG